MRNVKSFDHLLICAVGLAAASACKLAPPKSTATDGGTGVT